MATNAPPPTTGGSVIKYGSGGTSTQANVDQIYGSLFGVDQSLLHEQVPMPLPAGWTPSMGAESPVSMTDVVSLLSDFRKLSVNDQNTYARRLADAGYNLTLNKKGKYSPDEIFAGYKDAVLDAAAAGLTVDDYLNRQTAGQGAGAGAGVNTPAAKATNPLDAMALGNNTAESGLGYDLTQQQQSQFAQDFAGQENPYLQAGATVSEPGSQGWAQWAQQRVREFDPQRFDARKVVAGVDVIRKMLGGQSPATGVPGSQ